MGLANKCTFPSGAVHSGTVIFLHGSGDTGHNLIDWIRLLMGTSMQFPHIKIMFPTAPLQSYTPIDGELSNVWFDRLSINIEAREKTGSITKMYEDISFLINEEKQKGIPIDRIIVGGFSMGGALAMHIGYHTNTKLAGVFAHSSFLNTNSMVFQSLKTIDPNDLPELRMYHGRNDTLVPLEWGHKTFTKMVSLGVTGTFMELENTNHELTMQSLNDIHEWIIRKLPPENFQNKL